MGNRAFVAVVATLLASLATWPLALNPSEGPGSSQVGQLLSDTKSLVSLLKSDISTLDFFALSGGGWQTHAVMLNLYSERTAALRSQALRLEAMRQNGSRWQQIAVDRIIPVMNELASSAETAINATKTNQPRLSSTEYREYLKLNSDLAEELSTLIAAWVDYAKTREDLDRSAEKIGAPPGSL